MEMCFLKEIPMNFSYRRAEEGDNLKNCVIFVPNCPGT